MTDARDVHDEVSTEKGGLPQQKALTLEIVTIRERLVTSGAHLRWTADENMIMNGLTKDHRESRQHSLIRGNLDLNRNEYEKRILRMRVL